MPLPTRVHLAPTAAAVLLALTAAASGAAATPLTTTVKSEIQDNKLTVTITKGSDTVKWDNLEIRCGKDDVIADYATATPGWGIAGFEQTGNVKYLKLVTPQDPGNLGHRIKHDASEVIVITGPEQRGGGGMVYMTLGDDAQGNGIPSGSAHNGPTFLAYQPSAGEVWPAVGWPGRILLVLLAMSGGIYLLRRRASTGATPR
ncbi:MAG: hypothetical protein HZB25_12980 [Candidatus Eisenbacteria bacterium]|nr:hypothetical protein [Candidatus Eisenbacteria bacterium]